MEVKIISRECIKPSSPTPLHLKTYKLSLLDQCRVQHYGSMLLYYQVDQDFKLSNSTDIEDIISSRLQLLKQSLSENLALFYPFAGKMKDNLSVDCNDEGVYFIEALVKSPITEFLNQPDHTLINKFIPSDPSEQDGSLPGVHTAKIQVTTFACGGLIIGASIYHVFGDGITLSSFLKSWAATMSCKSGGGAVRPNGDASSLFPQNAEFPGAEICAAMWTPFLKSGRYVLGRFVFDGNAITTLKARATSSLVKNPTRVVVVSAFISKCIMKAFKTKTGSHKPTLLCHAVDIRGKVCPPLSEYSMGNIIFLANALCMNEPEELDGLVGQMRKAIMKIDEDFVESIKGESGYLNFCEAMEDQKMESSIAKEKLTFSSWCKFGLHDIDFGWGKPIWISCNSLDDSFANFMDTIILVNTRSGEGIEAWLYLLEEDMNILQHDQELLAFATFNPSPLEIGGRPAASRL